MSLNYTNGCVNFRDLGGFLNLILAKETFNEGVIYRGGSIDYVETKIEIGEAKSIINLRNRPDFGTLEADYFHFPMANKTEKYDTSQKEVRRWLNNIVKTFENPTLKYPVLIHCLSGKDRTGIVVAVLLLILGIDKSTITEEYLLSTGEVKKEWIALAIDGAEDTDKYFNRVDLAKVRQHLMLAFIKN